MLGAFLIFLCTSNPDLTLSISFSWMTELIDDRDIVRAAISQAGLELQYASLRLQADPDIVRLACQSDGRALGYCPPGSTRDELTSDRVFMKNVVLSKKGSGRMWKLTPPQLKEDPELLLQALMTGLNMRDIPVSFKQDVHFLKQALGVNSHLYHELHPKLQGELMLAREAIIAPDSTPEIHAKALGHCPLLKSEREVVLSLCQRGDVELLPDLLQLPSSLPFTDDGEIMIAGVSRDPRLLVFASPRLRVAPELLLVSITPTSAYEILKALPVILLRDHPQIPTRAVEVCIARKLRYLPPHIPDDVWANHRPLCRVWLERGGRVLEMFEQRLVVKPPYTEEDIELPLAVARYNWRETQKVGEALLGDRDFIIRALELDGRILRFAAPILRQELEIQVMAVANYNKNIPTGTNASIQQYLGGFVHIPGLTQYIEERLQLHHTFCQFFLRGIAIPRPHRPPQLRSQLPMLDRGVETSEAFKRLIAEYLGVPLGQQLSLLRRAGTNLANSSSSDSSGVAISGAEVVEPEDFEGPHAHWFIPPIRNQDARQQEEHPPALRLRNRERARETLRQRMLARRVQDRRLLVHVMGDDADGVDFDDDDDDALVDPLMDLDQAEALMNAFDDEGF
jgi:hypothetical protein